MRDPAAEIRPAVDLAQIPHEWGHGMRIYQEAYFQSLVEGELNKRNEPFRSQFRCLAGFADIVSDTAVYEVKCRLSAPVFIRAVGQVLMYRQCINPRLKAIVVGIGNPSTDSLYEHARVLGVDVWDWSIS